MNKQLITKSALLCLLVLAATGVAFIDRTDASIAGDYVWISRPSWHSSHDDCQAQNLGSECVELCIVSGGGVISMNKYCCLDPSLIGGWDHPDECTSWLH